MAAIAVPPVLARNVAAIWGAAGERWLARLPALAAAVARDWDLTLGETYPPSLHWVAAVTRPDGSPAVLKLGVPGCDDHLDVEAAALAAFAGRGAARLLDHDAARGALLLERVRPGTLSRDLVPRDDAAATAAIIGVARRLHEANPPPNGTLPDLVTYGAAFEAHLHRYPGDEPLPRELVRRAGKLFGELCGSATERVLLHGDLHHDNVLRGERAPWLAIDPHGLVGDPGFEASPMLYNPDPDRRDGYLTALVPARIEQLAGGLALPVDRVVAWGFVMAVLSEVWTMQAGPAPTGRALDVAVALLPRLP